MGEYLIAVGGASAAWFLAAAVLFFNKPVDAIYRSEERHPAVRSLPQNPRTIGKILSAVGVQCLLWAGVYRLVADALPQGVLVRGTLFAFIIVAVKIIPRDVDRLLLTTYPPRRLTIELAIGVICAEVVGLTFAALL